MGLNFRRLKLSSDILKKQTSHRLTKFWEKCLGCGTKFRVRCSGRIEKSNLFSKPT